MVISMGMGIRQKKRNGGNFIDYTIKSSVVKKK